MFNRLKKLWKLTKNPEILPEHVSAFTKAEKAEFLSDMTDEEVLTYQKENEEGWKPIYDKIRSIIHAGPSNTQE